MARVRLRAVRETDLAALADGESRQADPWNWFGYPSAEARRRGFAENGLLGDHSGTLAVQAPDGTLAGSVGWHTVQHGPGTACQALNIGISLLPSQRGQGHGSAA